MAQTIPHIAVLITCYNRKQKTIKCLDFLFRQNELNTAFTVEVFLVDDGSTDGTDDAVRSTFPAVNIIKGSGSLYWNRGMHLAWQQAKATKSFDYYLWLNDDTDIKPGAVIEMLACTVIKNNNAIVCGAICSEITGAFTYGGRDKNGRELLPDGTLQFCYTINGNCVMVSSKVCEGTGILDPIYPHAIGDYEYGLRALQNGFEIVTTRVFIGFCERNASLPAWCYNTVPFPKRIKALYSPLGNAHPYYFFIFERKYYGWLQAVKHYLSIHLRVLIPALWK
ncbi:MAG: glycosyltransferase [Agriterribacter sp.]